SLDRRRIPFVRDDMAIVDFAKKIARATRVNRFYHSLRSDASIARYNELMNINPFFDTASPSLLVALVHAFEHLKSCAPELLVRGSYLEFGLFKGFSLWFAESLSRERVGPEFKLYGFDSFAGLPATEVDKAERNWSEGAYAISRADVEKNIKSAGGDLSRITL